MASRPEVIQAGDSLVFHYRHDQVRLRLSRWRDARQELSCELLVQAEAHGVDPHLHVARWNLLASRSRTMLANVLHERFADPDWVSILEDVAREALERRRHQTPVILLGHEDAIPTTRWLAEPLLLQGDLNMLFGAPGAGKGLLALALALSVQSGVNILGLPNLAGPQPVLYLDYEWSRAEASRRVRAIARGAGLPVTTLPYMECAGRLLADSSEEIAEEVADRGVQLVVVDSVGLAGSVGTGEGDPAGPFIRIGQALRSLRVTCLLIDHDAKGSQRGHETPYGTRYKQALCRNTWVARKTQQKGTSVMDVGLWHNETSNIGYRAPLGWRIRFESEQDDLTAVRFSSSHVEDVEEFGDLLSDWEQIERLLGQQGKMTAADIANALGKPKAQVSVRLSEHRKRGHVELYGGDLWGLRAGKNRESVG